MFNYKYSIFVKISIILPIPIVSCGFGLDLLEIYTPYGS